MKILNFDEVQITCPQIIYLSTDAQGSWLLSITREISSSAQTIAEFSPGPLQGLSLIYFFQVWVFSLSLTLLHPHSPCFTFILVIFYPDNCCSLRNPWFLNAPCSPNPLLLEHTVWQALLFFLTFLFSFLLSFPPPQFHKIDWRWRNRSLRWGRPGMVKMTLRQLWEPWILDFRQLWPKLLFCHWLYATKAHLFSLPSLNFLVSVIWKYWNHLWILHLKIILKFYVPMKSNSEKNIWNK